MSLLPWYLKLLVILAVCASVYGIGAGIHHHIYQQGFKASKAISDKQMADMQLSAAQALDRANTANRAREQKLTLQLSEQSIQYAKEKDDATAKINGLLADLHSAKLHLSVAISATSRAKICANPAIAGELGTEARAELSEQVSGDILRLAGEADDTARQLNGCIDAYNAVAK